ncbi:expressed unknown protein [Ectocarpus siliculosus]|uniref:Uncharacterized protein n=1 Tax=Ectocarpus siliculosus TaxID=2880 RepID=D8LD82_ECTSI|nr:expressed unknown protein [Ectocarpus siliculosus]|eukprot:CBN75535.1 expressed unknown protein [Ectocarpus siliculosus]
MNVHAVGQPPPWCLRFPVGVLRSGGVAEYRLGADSLTRMVPFPWWIRGVSGASAIRFLGGHLSM